MFVFHRWLTLIEARRCIQHMEESEFFTCMDVKCAQSLVQEVMEGDSFYNATKVSK